MRFLKKYNLTLENSKLLNEAITHSSYAYENNLPYNYEKLEFLGDAVLQVIISEYLYKNGNHNEGAMSKVRASYVCEAALDYYADVIKLKPYIKVGHGQSVNEAITADIFEAVLAAIYLEKGFDAAKEYIYEVIIPQIESGKHFFDDYKTLMQEYCQTSKKSITYKVIDEKGEPHNRVFTVELVIDDKVYGKGIGKNKKEAEQKAAKDAYNKSVKSGVE